MSGAVTAVEIGVCMAEAAEIAAGFGALEAGMGALAGEALLGTGAELGFGAMLGEGLAAEALGGLAAEGLAGEALGGLAAEGLADAGMEGLAEFGMDAAADTIADVGMQGLQDYGLDFANQYAPDLTPDLIPSKPDVSTLNMPIDRMPGPLGDAQTAVKSMQAGWMDNVPASVRGAMGTASDINKGLNMMKTANNLLNPMDASKFGQQNIQRQMMQPGYQALYNPSTAKTFGLSGNQSRGAGQM